MLYTEENYEKYYTLCACIFSLLFTTCRHAISVTEPPAARSFRFDSDKFNAMRAKWDETKALKYRFAIQIKSGRYYGRTVSVTVLNGKRIDPETLPPDSYLHLIEGIDTIEGIYNFVEKRVSEDKKLYEDGNIIRVNAEIIYDDDRYYPDTVKYSVTGVSGRYKDIGDYEASFSLELGGFRDLSG